MLRLWFQLSCRMLILALVATTIVGCNGPIVVIPGGALGGNVQPAPSLWTQVPETIQLETRPSDPYSINIWAVGIDSVLYVATGADGTRWSEHMTHEANVRVRFGETIFELTAAAVNTPEEQKRVADAYITKYDLDADDWVVDGLIYRLDRR